MAKTTKQLENLSSWPFEYGVDGRSIRQWKKTMEAQNKTMTEESIKDELRKLPRLDDQAFVSFAKSEQILSDEAYENFIDRLDVSDNWKVFLRSLIRMTKKVCNVVIEVGKVVLNIVMDGVRRFPYAIGGAVVGLLIGMLLYSIPLLGIILGPVFAPLLGVVGGLAGLAMDVSDVVFYGLRDCVAQYFVVR